MLTKTKAITTFLFQTIYKYELLPETTKEWLLDAITFRVLPRPRPTNHRFTIIASNYESSLSENTIISRFAGRLSKFLETDLSSEPPGRFTFLKISFFASHLSITWFDNLLGSFSTCDQAAIAALLAKMTGEFLQTFTNQRLPPSMIFKKAFQPKFDIKGIKLVLLGPCVVKETFDNLEKNLKPPVILPPFPSTLIFTSTDTIKSYFPSLPVFPSNTTLSSLITKPKTTTPVYYPYIAPFLSDPNLVYHFFAVVGKLTIEHVDELIFIGGPVPSIQNKYFLKLESETDDKPNWLAVNSSLWSLLALPTLNDFSLLEVLNSTHKLWRGKLSAFDEFQRTTNKISILVYVTPPAIRNDVPESLNHIFKMKIGNFNIQVSLQPMLFHCYFKYLWGLL